MTFRSIPGQMADGIPESSGADEVPEGSGVDGCLMRFWRVLVQVADEVLEGFGIGG